MGTPIAAGQVPTGIAPAPGSSNELLGPGSAPTRPAAREEEPNAPPTMEGARLVDKLGGAARLMEVGVIWPTDGGVSGYAAATNGGVAGGGRRCGGGDVKAVGVADGAVDPNARLFPTLGLANRVCSMGSCVVRSMGG